MKLFDIKGKVVVIVGGTGVLCQQISFGLAQEGVKVVILGRNKVKCDEVVKKIKLDNGEAIGIEIDVFDKKSLECAREKIINQYKKIDVLINGIGGNVPEATTQSDYVNLKSLDLNQKNSFFNLDINDNKSVFDTNFFTLFLSSQVFGKYFAEQKAGNIINISSISGDVPVTRVSTYSAAKAAVSNFTKWLSVHFSSINIRVNSVAPGFFLTTQNRYLLYDEKSNEMTERCKKIIEHTPIKRLGLPKELIGTIIWLISDASSFVTGAIVPVDGGFSAYSGV